MAIFAVRGARQARGFPVQVRTAMVEGCVEVDRTALHGGKPGNLLEDILAARSEAKLRGRFNDLKGHRLNLGGNNDLEGQRLNLRGDIMALKVRG